MLAPIVTKDMKLFPTRPVNTVHVKNVRSRAQSLQNFANANTKPQRVKAAPGKPRTSQSVGNLSLSRSPPKASSFRKQLQAITEGVEMPTFSGENSPTVKKKEIEQSEERPPTPEERVPGRPCRALSIGFDDLTAIGRKDFVDPTITNSENNSATSSAAVSPSSEKSSPSAGRRLINKITSVFKHHNHKSAPPSKNSADDNPTTPN